MAALCTPTANGYGRFQPNALAPNAAVWGRDNRGAMLRVVGGAGDPATRIENRLGEPAANPYVYMASQIIAGLDGLAQGLPPPPACDSPYAVTAEKPVVAAIEPVVSTANAAAPGAPVALPRNLQDALHALQADGVLTQGLGSDWVRSFVQIKQLEHQRHTQAPDVREFERREYFNRL
jgi:glutamine synthetase